jgi:ribosomal-protein-serine acetyltransferase
VSSLHRFSEDTPMAATVSLRPFERSDLEELCEAIAESAAELRTWMAWFHDEYGREQTEEWLAGRHGAWDSAQAWDFAIVGPGGRLLGSCGLHHIDLVNRHAELGYWIRTSATGQGVATEATRQLCQWAFREQRMRRIEIVVALENVASQRVAKKVGAVREGLMRQRLVVRDNIHDAVIFGLLRDELVLG